MKFLALATMCLAGSALALTGLSGNGTAVAGGAAAPHEWLGRAMPMDAMVKPHKSFMRSLSRGLVRWLSRFAPSLAGLLAPRTKDAAADPWAVFGAMTTAITGPAKEAFENIKRGVTTAAGMADTAFRTALARADALARQARDTVTYKIQIKNSLPFAAQVALANPADDVKYKWEKIPAGGTHTFDIFGAPVFNMYVVPYVDGKSPPDITSGEEAFKAIKWYGTKVVTLYNVVSADDVAEKAAKEAWEQFKGAAQAQAEKEAAAIKGQVEEFMGGETGAPDSPQSLAKMFREVKPNKLEGSAGESELTLSSTEGIVLSGAAQQCQGDEEMFWGCCYKKCSDLAGANHQYRCNFFMCGKDATCAVADSKTDFANYGSGFTKSGLCRPPSADRVG